MFQNTSSLARINNDVEAHIKHALLGREPACVYEPMYHLIFDAPVSLAPNLCIAACEAVGGQKDQAIGAASALHLMHAAAFTHETLLSSDQRKPKTNPHSSFAANIHLLAGDGILPLGYELLTKLDDNPGKILKAVVEISSAMGPKGMVEGQYEEIKPIGPDDGKFEARWMDSVCRKKEGKMYACAAACGAILGGGNDENVEALRRYGHYIGLIHGMVMNQTGTDKIIRELRYLALHELRSLQLNNIEALSSFMDNIFPSISENRK